MYGSRLKELRKEQGLTQTEFAKMLHTTQKNISKYELEYLDLNTDMIIQICKTFNVSADYLLGRSDDFGNVDVPSDVELSSEEQYALDMFRDLSNSNKKIILRNLFVMLDPSNKKKYSFVENII